MRRPIRVLHVLASFRTGGTEQGVVNLVNHSDPGRVQAGICLFDEAGASESLERMGQADIYLRTARKRFGNDPSVGFGLAACLRKGRFDLLHSHGWPTYLESWLALRLCAGVPSVHGEHGTSFLDRRRRRWAFGALAGRWRVFLFVSESLRDQFRRLTRIPAERMEVIPNGVDFARFDPSKRREEARGAPFEAGWLHIGTAGRLQVVKNHDMLLAAAEGARAMGKRWRFHIAGEGPLRARHEAKIRDRELGDHVVLHGRVERIESFYRKLDIFALTSDSEGHPNALLEALASGLPVISTPVGDVPRFLRDGENGWIVDRGDASSLLRRIERLAGDAAGTQAVARKGYAEARERFSVHAMAEAYTRLYERVVGE